MCSAPGAMSEVGFSPPRSGMFHFFSPSSRIVSPPAGGVTHPFRISRYLAPRSSPWSDPHLPSVGALIVVIVIPRPRVFSVVIAGG